MIVYILQHLGALHTIRDELLTCLAIAFNSHLGYNITNWKEFEHEILEKVKVNPAKFDREDENGKYFDAPMVLYGKKKDPMDIMTVWEVEGEKSRMITAFPNSKKE